MRSFRPFRIGKWETLRNPSRIVLSPLVGYLVHLIANRSQIAQKWLVGPLQTVFSRACVRAVFQLSMSQCIQAKSKQ